jgi:dTDP-glucose 4,6-dehydratase
LQKQPELRLLHVSTDEVFGSLGAEGLFSEDTPYRPTSPYSATKAASDHLVRAWFHTYALPVLITNCSNNYGPCQHPEKLIPLVIARTLAGESIPVYGNGQQIRDWLFVDDHVRGLLKVLEQGRIGETYNIGGEAERTNLQVIETILAGVATRENLDLQSLHKLIDFVTDRPGHDRRYAEDTTKIRRELNWQPSVTFADGIGRTLDWYATNPDWCAAVGQTYAGERLGLSQALIK